MSSRYELRKPHTGIYEKSTDNRETPGKVAEANDEKKAQLELPGHDSTNESINLKKTEQYKDSYETDITDNTGKTSADKYEKNPFLLTEKSRAEIREGILNGDIKEADIRDIGRPLREKYNGLFEDGFKKLSENEELRKELLKQEIYSKDRNELMSIKDQLQVLRISDTEIMMEHTPIKNMEKVLMESREIGVPENDIGQLFVNEDDISAKRAISVINEARTRLPTDWVKKSNNEPILVKHVSRGYFIKEDGVSTIALSSGHGMERCAYHELGHHIEEMYPEIRKLEHEFYNRRTDGEKSRWLGLPYSLKEKTRFDQFRDPYMGKDYGNKEDSGYEILSMGMEGLYTGAYKLHMDTDYQDFIFGVLATV